MSAAECASCRGFLDKIPGRHELAPYGALCAECASTETVVRGVTHCDLCLKPVLECGEFRIDACAACVRQEALDKLERCPD